MVLYPNMGTPVRKSLTPSLGFYFAAYADPSAPPKQALVELLKGEAVAAKLPLPLPVPDASGRIQHAATLPVQALAPGEYSLRVTLTAGAKSASRQTRFVGRRMKGTSLPNRGALRLLCLSILSLAASAPGLRARRPRGAEPPPQPAAAAVPQIAASRVDQVTVDVVVLDRRGQPVKGLTQADFTILDEGRPQSIVSFDMIEHTPASAGSAPPAPAAGPEGRDERRRRRTARRRAAGSSSCSTTSA